MKAQNQEVFLSTEFLRDSSDEELKALIKETQRDIFEVRNQLVWGRKFNIERPHLVNGYKKLIARAKTILNERRKR